MSSYRHVARVVTPQSVIEGAGVRLKRSIATSALNYLDPFLLFDHFGSDNPDDYLAGFPMHPHRGIETVTYMLSGNVRHADSIGNSGHIYGGDVQWMTSGGGIMHEEMPEPVDGQMEGFQLWVNLPASLKMSEPRYQEIKKEAIPVVRPENGITVRIIAGLYHGQSGAVTEVAIQPLYLDVELCPKTVFEMEIPETHTVFSYLYSGEISFGVQDEIVRAPRLVVLEQGDHVRVQSHVRNARFLLVAGQPIYQPIARYGPFVMNTQSEIEEALDDLRKGTFIWSEKVKTLSF